ncbi:MAG: hypothetical protein Q9219_004627 [cf. Caloplaca sp. 3 TL-2023]
MYGEDSCGRVVSLFNRQLPPINCRATTSDGHHGNPPRPIIKLPPLDSSRRYHASYRQRPRSQSPDSSSASTPPLVRHNSTSSQSEATISPMTPSYTQDQFDGHNRANPYFATPNRCYESAYQNLVPAQHSFTPSHQHQLLAMGSINDSTNGLNAFNQHALHNLQPPLAYPDPEPSMTALTSTANFQPAPYTHTNNTTSTSSTSSSQPPQQPRGKTTSQSAGTQTTTNVHSPTPSTAPPAPPPPKKKYPCPHAALYNCSDTFTTSGHASRHGKKHTGEKSVICPTCSKAFTRKDNMKQHERTHRNVGSKNGQSSSAATSPTSTTKSDNDFSKVPLTNGQSQDLSGRSEEEDGEGESPELDALAVVTNSR